MKTVFEKVIDEIRNIQYALNYFIRLSEKNKNKRPTRISSHDNNKLKKQLMQKAMASIMSDYPDLLLDD